ncbi:imidazolonepropionase [Flavisolibacter ginsengisoli]|jgi:imidazolonepropionase|uniref:Imidazolonepropionase n=1 Tax=Flavisolibacter ginsengisoli DSM 18119 TaxID=1121884 RepID=A0A1M4WLD7_9BACT|nr:imidazolonepropionase [Flavisolibacter ginsengisoli]SHE82036.1 imidazolonepropionase [Flavisolibacter ginsengisoli DSM 18119]
MTTLIYDIGTLVNVRQAHTLLYGKNLALLPCIHNAFLIVEDGRITDYGRMEDLFFPVTDFTFHYSAEGRCILPSYCDSHTHLVFAGSREDEFVDKIKGLSYSEIAAKGGGILNSARKLQETSEEFLYQQSYKRLQEIIRTGTGAVEIKSGYGLTVEDELKMLKVIRRLKESSPIPVRSTFLGAHALPEKYKDNREGYIQLIIEEMLPRVSKEGLADYIDVFCEKGFYTPEETKKICRAGKEFGLKPKIHANQLYASGGVQAGVELNAVSVDHLESMDDDAIVSLAHSNTIGTLLPTAAFFLRMPYQPARKLIDSNCAIALASDFNPGSSPSGNMNFVVAISCIQMRMLPEEAINASTLNGAYAMELQDEVGSISKGKRANLVMTVPVPSIQYLPYSFGSNLIEKVMVNGEFI